MRMRSTRGQFPVLISRPAVCEAMEPRVLLSAAHPAQKAKKAPKSSVLNFHGPIVVGKPVTSPGIQPLASAPPPFTPSVIRHFYGVDNIYFNGVVGNGAGQTIAVIDAFHDPKFSATGSSDFGSSDLHVFDYDFGLPDPPSFKQIPEAGYSAVPTTYNAGWAGEEALDIEWAHAMAPAANIIAVECANQTLADDGVVDGSDYALIDNAYNNQGVRIK
jgi:subtilase family serine protease